MILHSVCNLKCNGRIAYEVIIIFSMDHILLVLAIVLSLIVLRTQVNILPVTNVFIDLFAHILLPGCSTCLLLFLVTTILKKSPKNDGF